MAEVSIPGRLKRRDYGDPQWDWRHCGRFGLPSPVINLMEETAAVGRARGVELADDAAEKYPFTGRPQNARLHLDGSVIDQ